MPTMFCRRLKRYWQKNGYTMRVNSPELGLIGVTREFLDSLVKNGIVEVLPLYEGGTPVAIELTDKGYQMATAERKRRRHW